MRLNLRLLLLLLVAGCRRRPLEMVLRRVGQVRLARLARGGGM
jgi:hypothetical protein